MLKKIYNKIDSKMVYLAGKSLQAYNWVTGRTKSDLANELLTAGCIMISSGAIINSIGLGLISTPIFLGTAHILQSHNKRIERLESKALENSCKDFEVEGYKMRSKYYCSPLNFGGGGLVGFIGNVPPQNQKNTSLGSNLIGGGMVINGLSFYVMRVENPPKKRDHVFKRVTDKLVDKLKQGILKPEPAMLPVLKDLY